MRLMDWTPYLIAGCCLLWSLNLWLTRDGAVQEAVAVERTEMCREMWQGRYGLKMLSDGTVVCRYNAGTTEAPRLVRIEVADDRP